MVGSNTGGTASYPSSLPEYFSVLSQLGLYSKPLSEWDPFKWICIEDIIQAHQFVFAVHQFEGNTCLFAGIQRAPFPRKVGMPKITLKAFCCYEYPSTFFTQYLANRVMKYCTIYWKGSEINKCGLRTTPCPMPWRHEAKWWIMQPFVTPVNMPSETLWGS